jgi:hypothetical protein
MAVGNQYILRIKAEPVKAGNNRFRIRTGIYDHAGLLWGFFFPVFGGIDPTIDSQSPYNDLFNHDRL